MLACFLQWQYWKCIFPLHCANVREEVVENIHTPTDGLNVAPAYTQEIPVYRVASYFWQPSPLTPTNLQKRKSSN